MAYCNINWQENLKPAAPISNEEKKRNVNTVMRILLESGMDGMTKAIAAGFCGHFWGESAMNPGVKGDSGTSLGIGQWHDLSPGKGRMTNLKNYAKSIGRDPTDIEVQAQFVIQELKGSYYKRLVWDKIKGTDSVEHATQVILEWYGRGNKVLNKEKNPQPYIETLRKRASYALRFYQDYQ